MDLNGFRFFSLLLRRVADRLGFTFVGLSLPPRSRLGATGGRV